MRKRCCICGIEKSIEEFNKNRTRKDGFQIQCRDCGSERSKQYYKENKTKHSAVCALRARQIERRNRERIEMYLSTHPCVDCGETDIVVLDFDHVRGTKFMAVSRMVAGYSWATIMREIKKCEVRCANDHRRVTAKRRMSGEAGESQWPVKPPVPET